MARLASAFALLVALATPGSARAQEPAGSPSVPELIVAAARRHGMDPQRPLRIAGCESRWGADPAAYWPWRAHLGVFQFNRATWEEQAPRHGLPDHFGAALDDALNVELALALMARGQWSRWACI